jgi:hypothetical protein
LTKAESELLMALAKAVMNSFDVPPSQRHHIQETMRLVEAERAEASLGPDLFSGKEP